MGMVAFFKFDLDAKQVKVNLGSSFEKLGRAYICNTTYQVTRSLAVWFWRRFLKGFTI